MKKSKFTEAQIVFAIKQSDLGVKVEEICRKMGISEATFYNWKKKYGGLGISELRELRCLHLIFDILISFTFHSGIKSTKPYRLQFINYRCLSSDLIISKEGYFHILTELNYST